MRTAVILAIVLCCFAAAVVEATYGVDVSQRTSRSSFECLKGRGIDFAVVRAFESIGRPDPNAPGTVADAWAAGLAHVDVYMFPCPTCGNPAGQVNSLMNFLHSNSVRYGMIWLDIEGPQYWMGQAANREFFSGLLSSLHGHGAHVGIYSSASQWEPIFGNWDGASSYPLWYAHYDGEVSFSDFSPFAGWRTPSIKQYQGTTSLCSAGVDMDWYPN
eukprot:TRINITY_DN3983_c0_g1_i7.p1 TRINITY_DN3983_c0_g1~~TRINITY_DN3983_c0_g1_i7.p1  ORF type:complete len:216 (-),score=55.47 TRINITY_DN3983_c0_g1_i7:314-961(-)